MPVAEPPVSLVESVYRRLLDRILSGAWSPGGLCDRRSIAKELGVSIAPVGEAMVRLAEEGFLVNLPRRGTMLRPSDPRRLFEGLMWREAIECQAVGLAHGARLTAAAASLRELAARADGELGPTQRQADLAFHRLLVGLAGIEVLSEQWERLGRRMLFDELHQLDLAAAPQDRHADLLADLLAAPAREAAAERLRRHLRAGRAALLDRFLPRT